MGESRTMSREDAVDLICRLRAPILSDVERTELLWEWWHGQEDDPHFLSLPPELQAHVRTYHIPKEPLRSEYDPIVPLELKRTYVGVRNDYIERQLAEAGEGVIHIEGEPEALRPCPCCGYRTLDQDWAYDFCDVCSWQDGWSDDPDEPSDPNHGLSLAEARRNFGEFGAYREESREHVDPDGPIKYIKDG